MKLSPHPLVCRRYRVTAAVSVLVAVAALLVGASPAVATPSPSWSAPSPVDPAFNASSVSCPSSSFCVAVDGVGNALTYSVPPPPSNTSPPTISGTATQGQTLLETHGGWTNNPTSYSYQWEDCDSGGANCSAIAGADSQTYVLTASDVGHTIRVEESASNAGGTGGPVASTPTEVISAASTGSIAGTVTDAATSEPLAGIWACAYEPGAEAASEFVNCRQTDASGEYTILELPVGPYKVAFIDVNSTYAVQFYREGAPQGVPFFEDANSVPVGEGATTEGIDAQLLEGAGRISGNVTDDSSASLKGIRVCFIDSATSKGVTCVYTDTSGDYTVLGLPAPGSYKVAFIDKAGIYPTRFYDGKASLEEADPVPVNVGETTSGIDAALRSSDVSGSTLSGYVESASGEHAVDAPVAICPVGGSTCRALSTDPQGIYQATGVADGAYRITAYPPAGSNERPASVEATVAGGDVTAPDIKLLPSLPPPPAGTTIESSSTNPDEIPVVFVGTSPILSTGGCPGGIATFEIEVEEEIVSSGTFTESPEGSGQYYGQTGVLLAHGAATVTISITNCPNPEENKKIVFGIYIDPSGQVRDTSGVPVADATVELLRSESPSGPFVPVPIGSAVMSPSNRENPDTTDATGHFGWDVVAGYYIVRASKSGCVDATTPTQQFAETTVMTIPPPVTDLELQLDCGNGGGAGGGGGASGAPAATLPIAAPAPRAPANGRKKHHRKCKTKHGHKKRCGKRKKGRPMHGRASRWSPVADHAVHAPSAISRSR